MFFLGISAHFMIFLLLPALVVVNFYFRGTAGNPEVITLLPEVVAYVPAKQTDYEKTYTYQIKRRQKTADKIPALPLIPASIKKIKFPLIFFYTSRSVSVKTLRAPPFYSL